MYFQLTGFDQLLKTVLKLSVFSVVAFIWPVCVTQPVPNTRNRKLIKMGKHFGDVCILRSSRSGLQAFIISSRPKLASQEREVCRFLKSIQLKIALSCHR